MRREKKKKMLNQVQSWKNERGNFNLETMDDYELLMKVNKMLK